jgi:putative NIF3 family GTP cyclohydrolase 1 type 2
MNVTEFLDYVISHAGQPGSDEGVRVGDAHAEVTGVLVCFMATVEALQAARREGCGLVVTHETPFLPYPGLSKVPDDVMEWSSNRVRLREMEEGGLTVVRLHGSLDRWLVYDAFRELLALPAQAEGEGYRRVYQVEPAPLRDWIERAKSATGLDHVRFVGDPDRVVSRVGLPFGGLGLFVNIGSVESLIHAGADLLIGGESDDYALRYMADAGVAFIETGHSGSENPGLMRFAGVIREAFPELTVIYYDCPAPHSWA